jgi:hypothetical protein
MTTEKPSIQLIPLENTVVHTKTREEHTILLRVFEAGGLRWPAGELPTAHDYFAKFGADTYLTAEPVMGNGFAYGSIRDSWIKNEQRPLGRTKISPSEFYQQQGISPEQIAEINRFFPNDSDVNLSLHRTRQQDEWDAEPQV